MLKISKQTREAYIKIIKIFIARDPDDVAAIRAGKRDSLRIMQALEAFRREARNTTLDEAKVIGYLTCAQTRHVKLGDEVSSAIEALKENPNDQ